MTQGIVLFAYNTEQINYLRLATVAAQYAKRYMPAYPITLITTKGNWEWFTNNTDQKIIDGSFDNVVYANPPQQHNKRTHFDSPWHKFTSDFQNGNKHQVIDLSPYDQTMLLDIDYIVQNNQLEYVFESDSPVTLFHHAETLIREPAAQAQQYLNEQGIPMLWSTVIYFDRRQSVTKLFFDLWAHVSENYAFYQLLYNFPGKLYRTDFCVSIAAHILNGMISGSVIQDFPQPMIYMSQKDDIAKINQADEWVYLVNNRAERWNNTLTKIKNENVHVMNKRSIERHYDDIMRHLGVVND